MRGRWVSLSVPRRIVVDLMYFSAGVPWIVAERRLMLRDVAAARETHPARPSWTALFAKAYALVAHEMPPLRQAYVRLPWPHLYEYRTSTVNVAVERDFDGEKGLVFVHIADPAVHSLADISDKIRAGRSEAFAETKMFRRMTETARLPLLLRRAKWWIAINHAPWRANYLGTFGISTVASTGTAIVTPRSPLTTLLTYDTIGPDGAVNVRVVFDHRVLDAMTAARALERLQSVLNGVVADELRRGERTI